MLLLPVTPRTWDSVQEPHEGLWTGPRSLGFGLRASVCPAWFLDPWPASREHFEAG